MSCVSSALLALTVVSTDIGAVAAAPFPVNASAFRVPASNDRIDVRYRGGALAAGIVFGLIGAAIASQYYYYPSPYYYYPAYPRAYYYPSYSYYTPYPYYTPYSYYPAYWGYGPSYRVYPAYRVYPRYRYYRGYRRYRY
jgi:hypothetical protein